MLATDMEMSTEVFKFSGQTVFDTWKLREVIEEAGWGIYSEWLVNVTPFCMQRIRELADNFPFWQRLKKTGRPPVKERTLLIGFMVRQFFNATFRQLEGLLRIFGEFFGIVTVPDYTVFAKKNTSKRWLRLWKRFHHFVLKWLPKRKAVVATDATGYSGRKRSWRETDYDKRAVENWVKAHAAIEVDSFLILNYELTDSDVHESQMYEDVWDDLPDNVEPIRSLADSAYTSNYCIRVANKHGASAIHDVKKNAVHRSNPMNGYEKLVNFAKHWPNRFKQIKAKRAHVETTFGIVSECFNYRLRCRNDIARKNEVQAKYASHNIRIIAASAYMNGMGV